MRKVLLCVLALAACSDDAATSTPDARVAPPDAPTAAGSVEVQILAFNDFHGNLEPPAGSSGTVVTGQSDAGPITVAAGGAAFLADRVAKLRAENDNTIVVAAGDMIGASPLLSAAFHDEPTIEAMNLIGVDIVSVGNHEFDEGSSELLRMQFGGCHPIDGCQDGTPFNGAGYEYLSANVMVDEQTGRTLFPRYVIREIDGVKIAFIGMTLEATPEIVSPLGVAGLTFTDEVQTVNTLVPELHTLGIHAIVVVVHEGGFQTGLYDECVGLAGPIVDIATNLDADVDLVISGHTHAAYNCIVAGKHVTSALAFGRLVTQIKLTIDKGTKDVTAVDAHNQIVVRDQGSVAAVAALVEAYVARIAPIRDRVIGQTTAALTGPRSAALPSGESTLGNIIADGMLEATAKPGFGEAVIAFMNAGGVRADIDAGDVTYGEAFTVQPFGNSLVTLTITGAQIKTLLEQQFQPTINRVMQPSVGFSYAWSMSAPIGSKIDAASIKLGGTTIDPATSYRVTVNNFMATGGDGFVVLVQGTDRLGGAVDIDALAAYLAAHSPVAPPALGRITVIP